MSVRTVTVIAGGGIPWAHSFHHGIDPIHHNHLGLSHLNTLRYLECPI